MTKPKRSFANRPDWVSEELILELLEHPSFSFEELFVGVHKRLSKRGAASAGEEMLRLRVYEKLQLFVSQGLVAKAEKQYTPARQALIVRSAEMQAARAKEVQRRLAQQAPKVEQIDRDQAA